MSKSKNRLGRGLDALLGPQDERNHSESGQRQKQEGESNETGVISKIPVAYISANPFQPRSVFNPEAQEELKKSILINGLIQPVTVRQLDDGTYQLISGERRLKACRDIGYKTIPAYIIEVASDELMLAMALIENIQRERLNPIEEALAYKRLMDECDLKQEQIAERVGKNRSTIANSIRLLKLPEVIQQSLINGEISMGHARAIINIPEEYAQIEAFNKIKAGKLSVRKVEQLVKDILTGKAGKKQNVSTTPKLPQTDVHTQALEDRIRRIMGTKVVCKMKKNGAGEISIEFFSHDEMDRILELFEIIDKNNH